MAPVRLHRFGTLMINQFEGQGAIFNGVPVLNKPYGAEHLRHALAGLFA